MKPTTKRSRVSLRTTVADLGKIAAPNSLQLATGTNANLQARLTTLEDKVDEMQEKIREKEFINEFFHDNTAGLGGEALAAEISQASQPLVNVSD